MEILAQSSLLVALMSFAFGFSTLARNPRNILYLWFSLGCVIISGWATFYVLATIWPDRGYYRGHLLANVWIMPVALYFMQGMMRIEKWTSSRLLRWGGLGVAGALTILYLFGPEPTWLILALKFAPFPIVVQMVLLVFHHRKLDPVVGVTRRIWLYVGTLLVLATSVMDHIPDLWVGIPIFGNLTLTIFLYSLSQALQQQRLFRVGAFFTRFLVIAVVSLLLASVYSLVATLAGSIWTVFFLNSFIASFFLLSLLQPIQRLVRFVVLKTNSRRIAGLRERAAQLERSLNGVVDPEEALAHLDHFLTGLFRPRGAIFYLQSSDPTRFRRVRESHANPKRRPPPMPPEIGRSHELPSYLEAQPPATRDRALIFSMLELEVERMAGRNTKRRLEGLLQVLGAWEASLLLPFWHASVAEDGGKETVELLGWVVLQEASPPEEWGENWGLLTEIRSVWQNAGRVLSKMDVFRRQREVERLAALGEMAAGLAHEIRNPLGAIRGAAQLLEAQPISMDKRRFLEVIREESDRLNRVVTQFLDYSKPMPTQVDQDVDLVALCQKLATWLLPQVPRGVDLRFQSSLLHANILGNAEAIHQVLLNLLQNAFRAVGEVHGDRKSVLLSVDRANDHGSSSIRVTVQDTGSGIAPENLKKIFIPFFTTHPSGTGLGLSLCQKIVEAHHGRFEVQSALGEGSTFSFLVPERGAKGVGA